MKKILLTICLIICVLSATFLIFGQEPETEPTAQERINQTLIERGAADAELWEDDFVLQSYREAGKNVVFYTSEATGMRYTFDADTGELSAVSAFSEPRSDVSAMSVQPREPLPEEERRALAWTTARQELSADIIGELRLDEEQEILGSFVYRFNEYYDGIPTGTCLRIRMDDSGTVSSLIRDIGSIFAVSEDGTVVPANPAPVIAESIAIQTALREAESRAAEQGIDAEPEITCTLCVRQDRLIYAVEVAYYFDREYADGAVAEDHRCYYPNIDAYTGEIVSVGECL